MAVYEVATGDARGQVEGFCRHLTTNGLFDANSQPTLTWVNDQLDADAAYIGAKLEECGYSATQTDADVVQLLQNWNVIRTVIAVELSNPIEAVSGRGNPRFEEFKVRADKLEAVACGPGLADLGATVSGGLGEFLVATGVSRSRKRDVEDDIDHLKHRFRRGQFATPGVSDPTAETDIGVDA